MKTYRAEIKCSEKTETSPAYFMRSASPDDFIHSSKSYVEIREFVFLYHKKNKRVIIQGGPPRKLCRSDIRLIEIK